MVYEIKQISLWSKTKRVYFFEMKDDKDKIKNPNAVSV